MAATKNLVIDQGATFYANIQYLDTNKNPISLSGYNVRSKMRTSYDSPNAATIVATVTNATTGNVSLYMDAGNTSLLHYGRYVYDVEAYQGNTVIRIQEGAITVTPGVSGNNVGSILKQTLNSLVNNNYSVTLDANGIIQLPLTGLQNINPINGQISDQYWVAPPGGQVNLASNDGNNYVWVDDSGAYIATSWYTGAAHSWYFDTNGSITFPDGNSQNTAFISNNYINKSLLKSIVANSMSWSEFQANIAAL